MLDKDKIRRAYKGPRRCGWVRYEWKKKGNAYPRERYVLEFLPLARSFRLRRYITTQRGGRPRDEGIAPDENALRDFFVSLLPRDEIARCTATAITATTTKDRVWWEVQR